MQIGHKVTARASLLHHRPIKSAGPPAWKKLHHVSGGLGFVVFGASLHTRDSSNLDYSSVISNSSATSHFQIFAFHSHGLLNSKATMSTRQPETPYISEAHGLTGEAHKRFVIVTSLLCLIDQVRGEPT